MMVSDHRGPVDTTALRETHNCNEEKTDHNRLAFQAPSAVERDCRLDDSSSRCMNSHPFCHQAV
jgi:hypothetical protein